MSKQNIRREFGANAAAYATSTVHAQGSSLARLVELVNPEIHWRVLDIATGSGHTALAIAPHVAEVRASDITLEMRAQTQKLIDERGVKNVIVETADAEDLPYPDNTFHLLTCRIAPHHFADIPQFIQESARVLLPHGILAIVDNIVPPGPSGDYINAFEKLRDPSHGRCLSSAEWMTLTIDSGFTLRDHEIITKTIDFEFWAQRHDSTMKNYLRAMLSECSGAAADFLQPRFTEEGTQFKLQEGLFILQVI
jgi:ubiquinone/menaquinone biosynthesis C-methylase UbiE